LRDPGEGDWRGERSSAPLGKYYPAAAESHAASVTGSHSEYDAGIFPAGVPGIFASCDIRFPNRDTYAMTELRFAHISSEGHASAGPILQKNRRSNIWGSTSLRLSAFLILIAMSPFAGGAEPSSKTFDVLIKGGMLYDGTGKKPRVADVAIRGDRIAGLG